MATPNPNEGNPNDAGAANANSQASPSQGQPLEGDLAKLVAGLQKKLEAQDGEIRALKSGKDKAVNRLEKSNEDMLAKLGKYLDVDPAKIAEAQRQSILDDLVAERTGQVSSKQVLDGTGASTDNLGELGFIDNALELPANDSRVTELKVKYSGDKTAYLREAMKLKSQISQTKEPTPGEMPLPGGKPPPPKGDIQKVTDWYEAELKKIPRGNTHAVSNLKAEARKRAREIGFVIQL